MSGAKFTWKRQQAQENLLLVGPKENFSGRTKFIEFLEHHSYDHAVQDAIQAICLRHKYYGYRRVTVSLRRLGMVVNAKKVLTLMRENNPLALRRRPFLVPPSRKPESFVIVPNLVRGLCPLGPNQINKVKKRCRWRMQ
jgi:HTH-like domain